MQLNETEEIYNLRRVICSAGMFISVQSELSRKHKALMSATHFESN